MIPVITDGLLNPKLCRLIYIEQWELVAPEALWQQKYLTQKNRKKHTQIQD